MKTPKIIYATAGLLVSLVFSCSMEKQLAPASGKQGEIIVIIDRALWTSACGDSLRHYLSYPVYGLPQAEPVFTLLQQSSLTGVTRQLRNIIMVNIEEGPSGLSSQTDVYSKGQLIFKLHASCVDSIIACANRYRETLINRFLVKDRNDYINYFRRVTGEKNAGKVMEKFQVSMSIPKEYSLDVEKDDFFWFAREEKDMIMGILMWKEPYVSVEQVDTSRLLAKLNAMTKKYVPTTGNSWMRTETMIPPAVKTYRKNNVYSVQMNGLWKSVMGGGPYVSVSIVDVHRSQIVTAMGFVFFPRKEKRDYVRMLEAILFTMEPAP
ncbi:MAG: DUF4837 family protein [Bacteroidales bacterium]|jgi:hypothetical protein|nr:DUF4837 family protein [Bacteroidales bacterium]